MFTQPVATGSEAMISLLFILLAAVCKACADTVSHHFGRSVFKDKDPKWWDPSVSWQHTKFLPLTKYRADFWHLMNSGVIVCFTLAVVFHEKQLAWPIELFIAGMGFNLVFNVFYNKILV